MTTMISFRMTDRELAGIDRLRGGQSRGLWIRSLCADAVAARDGLTPDPEKVREVKAEREPAAGVVDEAPAPQTRMQREEASREAWRVAQRGGPNA